MYGLWNEFLVTAESSPGRVALIAHDREWTFGQWRHRAQQFAHAYLARRVNRFDRVLIWTDNTLETAAAILGAWAAGAIPVLAASMERAPQLQHFAEVTAPRLVVNPSATPLPDAVVDEPVLHAEQVPADGPCAASPAIVLPGDPASIVFTSGSTGRSKGVVQSHGSLMRGCRAVASYTGITGDDRIVCPVPWSFDYGYGQLLTTALLGAAQILPARTDPFGLCEAFARFRPTVFPGLPPWFTYLLRGLSPIRQTDLSSLRIVMNTGGTVPRAVLEDCFEVFDNCRFFLNYGLTESYRTCYLDPALAQSHPTSIGRGIPGVEALVLRDDGTPTEPGEEGEIVHRGDYLCMGYWNDPEATARALRPDPLGPRGLPRPSVALFTGDLAHRDEAGLIYFHGRRDQQLKSMGVRVSPAEVEAILYASGLVSEAAVFGMPHSLLGDEIWAAIVPADGVRDAGKAIDKYAREVMSQYMLPRRYLVKDALPRTATRKVDYPTLKAEAARAPSAALA